MTAALEFSFIREELAIREQDGTTVTLFWMRGTDIVAVAVVDHRNGKAFELVLEPHERALDVFYHPYAYAARRGLEIEGGVRRHEETVDV